MVEYRRGGSGHVIEGAYAFCGVRCGSDGGRLQSTGSTTCQCPKPVAYDDATLKKITKALRALPTDNVLHEAMDDYENERDDLRFCPAGTH